MASGSGAVVVAAVLAGGRSRRMGRPKALAPLGGRPLISYPLAAVEAASLEPIVVAKPDSPLPALSCRVVREPHEPTHPLQGVIAALGATAARSVVVVGCDMPLVPAGVLEMLAALEERAAVVAAAGRVQPLLARYDPAVAPVLEAALAGARPAHEAVGELDPRVVSEAELAPFGEPEEICFNVNTPADLKRAEALLDRRA